MLEYSVLLIIVFYVITCPWTKVEESFNTQAVHDFLYEGTNFSNYDHLTFPGVVPRTFVGAATLSAVCWPAVSILNNFFDAPKYVMLVVARCTLGLGTFLLWNNYSVAVGKVFGSNTRTWLILITCTQFHYLFYASRLLPNVFANLLVIPVLTVWLSENLLPAVFLATASVALFRCELILLYAPIFGVPILLGRLRFFSAVKIGLCALLVTLAISIPLDSYLWRKILWPEAYVWYYNVVLNQSKNWGVMPLLWYFYSALPRAMGISIIPCFLALFIDGKCRKLITPALFFIGVYSLLPHKELRFVMYTFPIFATCAARFCAKMGERFTQRVNKSFLSTAMFAFCILHLAVNCALTGILYRAASNNYPSGDAMAYMHRYDKTENLTATQLRLRNFDFLCVGSDQNLTETIHEHTKIGSYRNLFTVEGFDGVNVVKLENFPYFWVDFRLRDKVAMLGLKIYVDR